MSIYKDQAIKAEEITLRPVYFNNGQPLVDDVEIVNYREYHQLAYIALRNLRRDHACRNRSQG